MTTTAASLATMTPAEIDTLWIPLLEREAIASERVTRYSAALDNASTPSRREQLTRWVAEAQRELDAATADQEPFNAEWAGRGGWTRGYLAITNGRGHVHSSTRCSTCHRGRTSTALTILPAVSGLTEDEIVDLAGERACTVCYPDAPVEKLSQPTRLFSNDEIAANAERETKRAAKLERDAKKAAAAITNPDGSPLIVDGFAIKTERTAWTTIVDYIFCHRAYNYLPHAADCERILAALAAKTQRSVEDVHEDVEARVAAKARREHVTI